MTTMFDAVNVNHIPVDAAMVAGYVDGSWPTFRSLSRFKKARKVSIATSASSVADVLDVENGDASSIQAPAWVIKMRARRRRPIIYTSVSNWHNVRNAFSVARVPEPFYWIADWTGVKHLVPGAVATQWADGSRQYPGLAQWCDTSYVSPNWPAPTKGRSKVNLSLANVKAAIKTLETFLVKGGSYAVLVNDISKTVGMTPSVRAYLTAVAGAIVAVTHYNKTKPAVPAPGPGSVPPAPAIARINLPALPWTLGVYTKPGEYVLPENFGTIVVFKDGTSQPFPVEGLTPEQYGAFASFQYLVFNQTGAGPAMAQNRPLVGSTINPLTGVPFVPQDMMTVSPVSFYNTSVPFGPPAV